jgi:hypothetical protein
MVKDKINFIALAAGISTLLLIAISLFVPWWQFTVGKPAIQVNLSPVNFNLSVNGVSVAVPLLEALNIACLLTMLAGGITLLIYSVKPTQPYSKSLLGFGYKKPLYVLVAFIVTLIAVPIALQAIVGLALPLMGSASITLPQSMSNGSNTSINVSAIFEWPFYFAIIATALGIAARIYHRKIVADAVHALPPAPSIST